MRPIVEFCYVMLAVILTECRLTMESEEVQRLEEMVLSRHPMTVSGFSSGASMAQQVHISSSGTFDGVGAFTGVFYRCAGESKNSSYCWTNERQADLSVQEAVAYDQAGLIDPLSNLQEQKVFFWQGTMDDANPSIYCRLGIIDFYQHFVNSPDRIHTKLQSAYHYMPTNSVAESCAAKRQKPHNYLANCNYSGSYEVLRFLIGPSIIQPQLSLAQLQPLLHFDQSEFFGGLSSIEIGLDEVGFLYVPKYCSLANRCLLHTFFHGCTLHREAMNTTFAEKSGFLEVAEANNIVVLFPQAARIPIVNEGGCWDYIGFTGPYYATKRGPQIVAVNKMVDRLLGNQEEALVARGTSSLSILTFPKLLLVVAFMIRVF